MLQLHHCGDLTTSSGASSSSPSTWKEGTDVGCVVFLSHAPLLGSKKRVKAPPKHLSPVVMATEERTSISFWPLLSLGLRPPLPPITCGCLMRWEKFPVVSSFSKSHRSSFPFSFQSFSFFKKSLSVFPFAIYEQGALHMHDRSQQ